MGPLQKAAQEIVAELRSRNIAGMYVNLLIEVPVGSREQQPVIQLFTAPTGRHPDMSVTVHDRQWVIGNSADPVTLALTEPAAGVADEIIAEWENRP